MFNHNYKNIGEAIGNTVAAIIQWRETPMEGDALLVADTLLTNLVFDMRNKVWDKVKKLDMKDQDEYFKTTDDLCGAVEIIRGTRPHIEHKVSDESEHLIGFFNYCIKETDLVERMPETGFIGREVEIKEKAADQFWQVAYDELIDIDQAGCQMLAEVMFYTRGHH